MIVAVVVLFHIVGFLSSIDSVMSTRTAQGAIAWAISLNTFPYLAVPAYWILGRRKLYGYVVVRRATDLRNASVKQKMIETVETYRVSDSDRPAAALAAERLAKMPILRGNRVDLLIDGDATFKSIFRGIDDARAYVLVQFYTVRDDKLGRALKERLLASAARGVRVYFLYDELGSHQLPAHFTQELREVGVEIHEFNTRKGLRNRFQLNFRNHRKIVVVDGEVAWIGGHNVGDEYLGEDPEFGRWRDTHVRIEGPAALKAQVSFVDDWYWATETYPGLAWTGAAAPDGSDIPILVIPTGPADELETARLMFLHAIGSARARIWIASPYFVPDESIVAALQLASLRGVDVRILIPDKPDYFLLYLAGFSYFEEVSGAGVRFYRFGDGFLHEKVMLIDEEVAAIGTANFDNRSFRLNFEVTAFVADKVIASEVERMFEEDFQHCRLMEEGEFERKPFWFRLGVRVARLTAPLQ